jgi:peptide/nickel transport system ATP-binding protein
MELIRELAVQNRMATLFITHALGLAARYCERIVVMHAGHVVEAAPTKELFGMPRHPYTAKLIAATPRATMRLCGVGGYSWQPARLTGPLASLPLQGPLRGLQRVV